MAAPTISGSSFYQVPTTASTWASTSFSGVADGDWILAIVMSGNVPIPTKPSGWEIVAPGSNTGTRKTTIFGKIWHTGDPTSLAVSFSATTLGTVAFIWGSGGPTNLLSLVVGSGTMRGAAGSTDTTTLAKSINTTVADTLVLAISAEATNATESPNTIVSATGSFTQSLWVPQGGTTSDRIETVWVGSKTVSSPGASGDSTITYRNAQSANAFAIQIGIPPTDPVIPEYTVTTVSGRSGNGTELQIPEPRGLVDGDLLVVGIISSTSAGHPVTNYAAKGWWLIDQRVVNTRSAQVFARLYSSSMAQSDWYLTYTANGTPSAVTGVIRNHLVDDVSDLVIGTPTTRGGSNSVSTATSITTPGPNYLAIAFYGEATTATGTSWTQTTGDFTYWNEIPEGNTGLIESGLMMYKFMPAAGATGNSIVTYPNASSNGYGIQLGIPLYVEEPEPIDAPYVVGYSEAVSVTSSATLAVPVPDNLETGDALVALLRCQTTTAASDWVPQSGEWERIGPAYVGALGSRLNTQFIHIVDDPEDEPSSYTFSRGASDSNRRVGQLVHLRADGGSPEISAFWNATTNLDPAGTIDSAADAYAITGPAMTLYWAATEFASPNANTITDKPANYTDIRQSVTSSDTGISRTVLYTAWRQWDEGVSTTALVGVNWQDTPAGSMSGSLTFVTGETPDFVGEGAVAYDGNGEETRVFVMAAAGARTPSAIIPVRPGFDTVDDMLATPGFTWGHRGNSTVLPECSLKAYSFTAARGYGVLELSLARTSDGVWFGLHDQYLDRVALGTETTTLNPASMTWSAVQAYQNHKGDYTEPFMRWEEYVEAYGSTHIVVVDPKYALGSYRTEFLSMVNNDIGPDRGIIKYSGPGSTAALLSSQAQALGFETWGFFYIADASSGLGGNGNLQTWGPGWTLIGMEHGASQAIWDEALALSKPVIGHIASSQTQYDTAMTKGASGVQCSGTEAIQPVSWWTT